MIIGFFTDVLLFLSHPCCDSTPTYIMVEWESECCTNEGPSKNVFLTNWGIFQWMIDPFVFLVLCRALLSCVGLGPSFVLEMVTTRAMSRRLRKGDPLRLCLPDRLGVTRLPSELNWKRRSGLRRLRSFRLQPLLAWRLRFDHPRGCPYRPTDWTRA